MSNDKSELEHQAKAIAANHEATRLREGARALRPSFAVFTRRREVERLARGVSRWK